MADRQPGCRVSGSKTKLEVLDSVKANLARFTYALASFAALAITLGAGKRWS